MLQIDVLQDHRFLRKCLFVSPTSEVQAVSVIALALIMVSRVFGKNNSSPVNNHTIIYLSSPLRDPTVHFIDFKNSSGIFFHLLTMKSSCFSGRTWQLVGVSSQVCSTIYSKGRGLLKVWIEKQDLRIKQF